MIDHRAISRVGVERTEDTEEHRKQQRGHSDEQRRPPAAEHGGQQAGEDEHGQRPGRGVSHDRVEGRDQRQHNGTGNRRPTVIPIQPPEHAAYFHTPGERSPA